MITTTTGTARFTDSEAAAECHYSYWLPEGGQAIDQIATYPTCKSQHAAL